jgi:hypothetical protein
MCKADIIEHPIWTLEEQLKLFDALRGKAPPPVGNA